MIDEDAVQRAMKIVGKLDIWLITDQTKFEVYCVTTTLSKHATIIHR
jgi:hypothetical protein